MSQVPDELQALVRGLLTDRQWEVWERRHIRGWSPDAISLDLLLHKSTVRDHHDAALLKTFKAGIRYTPAGLPYFGADGTPYLEVTA